ncbi:alkanesulfonate monooxygenase SsuD/methylene tetrahydromethanopterin reductase-like flavin-dependent oxidoreductase (luciferase family) [Nonomuraea rubra]|uniref:Alkanesulfonate monooxygenase SsuD/methylene tetrahydromethanopterin reductase-like flavin-dependent oxidoreductase (Luciferase family) n=1 Tax=Nonomuraea rubra TaxID=46180 RepID=A0A7X0NV49_9ACTN|nr:alkanesulfonate monooxygenase SsuD/methylene tetrahydromethanopterin reductase-like flavin-dependent oxidoreductase (luciferase family) [Nonomuraea rubra]
MRLTTSLPTDDRGVPDVAKARHLEQLGYDAVGMADVIVGDGTPGADPALTLAATAAVTDRIGLEFGVLSLPLRPVAWVASQIQTLQQLSGGRVVLGVGIGGFPGSPFWRAVGAPATGRGRWTDTALRALPGLIAGRPTLVGETEVTLGPAAAVPPILVGGKLGGGHAPRDPVRGRLGALPHHPVRPGGQGGPAARAGRRARPPGAAGLGGRPRHPGRRP